MEFPVSVKVDSVRRSGLSAASACILYSSCNITEVLLHHWNVVHPGCAGRDITSKIFRPSTFLMADLELHSRHPVWA
jgi:hypothetical protein